MTSNERERLRATFDRASEIYHRARPNYPDEIFEFVVAASGVRPGDRVLEIGSGTGQATLPLARRGLRMTCVELGASLAAETRRNLAAFADVEVVHSAFEEWWPPVPPQFELALAATSWQWIDPAVRYARAWAALRPGGHLALWDAVHVLPEDGDPFFAEIQEVYEEIGEGIPPGTPRLRPGEIPPWTAEIEASGWFENVRTRQVDWEQVYDADTYLDLLNSFSGHIAMQPWQRERLYGEIRRRLARRADGSLRRHWGAAVHVARRRDRPARAG